MAVLNPRAVALQGIGSAVLLVALQGFVLIDQTAAPLNVAGVGGGTGSHISKREWLRRFEPSADPAGQLAALTALDRAKAARKRRRREEELLFLLS